MLRLAPPLVLLAAAAGNARAQTGDRYGPPAMAPAGYASATSAPALRGPAAPVALRTLSWPGKGELRAAAAPAIYAPPERAAPSAAGPQRFPGMSAYAAPALRTGAAPAAPSGWTAPLRALRTSHRAEPRGAWTGATLPVSAPPPAYLDADIRARGEARPSPTTGASQGWTAASAPAASAPATPVAVYGASTLPVGLAAPPGYVPPGPATLPQLAARAVAAAPPTDDTLPPPTVGRYGYVGPGRTDAAPTDPNSSGFTSVRAASPPQGAAAPLPGPPRPPAYARSYVLPPASTDPSRPAAQAAPAPAAAQTSASRAGDGGRRYSLHREYGMEPDPVPVPPQFFAATADLSTPDTAPAALRSRAAVNAARIASTEP